jgi:Xaa-Pro aminopeptidase
MTDFFSKSFFAGNRARLRQLFPDLSLMVITANGLLQRSGDAAFTFHQDSNFWYLTGVEEPDIVLVIDGGEEYLIAPELSEYQNIFDDTTNDKALLKQSGVQTVLPGKEGWEKLSARLRDAKKMGILTPNEPYLETYGMYVNPARQNVVDKILKASAHIETIDLRQQLASLRTVKQPVEVKAIQRAIDLTMDALKLAQQKLPKAAYEYELEAEVTGYMLRHGAADAWKPIIASGKKACTLHSHKNNAKLAHNELVVLDIGAEAGHYVADITRTWAVGGTPTKRQQTVFDAVLAVQEFAFALQKPGSTIRQNEQEVERFMGEKLRELGLIKTESKEDIRKYFPHATSHFLGIDPHDAGDYERPLEPGVVLTVEPGIYIPEEGIGVRIEDDILITKNGHKVLSERLPRTLA